VAGKVILKIFAGTKNNIDYYLEPGTPTFKARMPTVTPPEQTCYRQDNLETLAHSRWSLPCKKQKGALTASRRLHQKKTKTPSRILPETPLALLSNQLLSDPKLTSLAKTDILRTTYFSLETRHLFFSALNLTSKPVLFPIKTQPVCRKQQLNSVCCIAKLHTNQ